MTARIDILQASAWYPPHQLGGTEVYLTGLVKGLGRRRLDCAVLTPRTPGAAACHVHDGTPVFAYPPKAEGERASLAAFTDLLKAHPGAIYHQHTWTPDCGGDHLRIAKALGMATVLTIHMPQNICLRGTMTWMGVSPCDGRIEGPRCAECWAQGRGAAPALARALSQIPAPVSALAAKLPSRAATALGARALVRQRQADFAQMIANADRIVAVCGWLFDALALNGAPAEKLVLSRQGVSEAFLELARPGPPAQRAPEVPTAAAPLRLLYLGRWHPVKGLAVVIRALRNLPDAPVALTIHAPDGGPEEQNHRAEITGLAAGDARIVIRPPLPRAEIPAAMHGFDALVIPSTWLETGPLVALEAQAAGLFVLGSRLGGIAELIDTPQKGELVTAGDVGAWTQAIGRLARRRPDSALAPARVRSMDDAAADMTALYQSLT